MPVEPVLPLHNPAGPPRAIDAKARLFSWPQIAVAALFGTPITAGLLWFANARALGWRRPWVGMVVGALWTLLPYALSSWLHSDHFAIALLLIWPLFAGVAAYVVFGPVVSEGEHAAHHRRGGAAVVGAIALVVCVLVAAESLLKVPGAVVPRPEALPAAVTVGAVGVNHGVDVSVDDAQRAAFALDQAGFAKQGQLSLHLGREGQGFVARVRVPAPVTEELVAAGREVGRALANGLKQCVTTSLVRAQDDAPLAAGRSCPDLAPAEGF